MQCYIYRSSKQDEMYLYLRQKDQFADVPVELAKRFGRADFVMELDLSTRQKLARIDIERLRQALKDSGYFLQMPPKVEGVIHDGD